MTSSMSGAIGYPGASTGSKTRGLAPGMKHIPGHHRFQQFTPEQMQLMQQMTGMIGPESFLSKLAGGDEAAFAQMEAPALRQFGALQGNIASRFSGGSPFGGGGPGAMSARRSSGFQNTINQAASNFAQDLQAQRMGLQRQALGDIMSYSQMLMGQQPYGLQEKQQRQSSGWGGLAGATIGGLGGFALGGPMGAMGGAQLGYGLGSQF